MERDGGEIYCKNCGEILQPNRVQTREMVRQNGYKKDNHLRSGGIVTYSDPNMGINTQLGYRHERRNYGNGTNYYHLQKLHSRYDNDGKRRKPFLQYITQICDNLGLPDMVKYESQRLAFKLTSDDFNTLGKKRELTSMAIVNIVARNMGFGLTRHEMVHNNFNGVFDEDDLGRWYRELNRRLDYGVAPLDIEELIFRYFDKFDLTDQEKLKCVRIAKRVKECNHLTGKSPQSQIGTIIYMVRKFGEEEDKELIKQTDAAEGVGNAAVSIRKTYQTMRNNMDLTEELPRLKEEN